MKGDFTRDTFSPAKHFLRVLLQQGRVQVDADMNEQVAIMLRYLQTLATDLLGPHAGPAVGKGFGIYSSSNINSSTSDLSQADKTAFGTNTTLPFGNFLIGKGHYYVDGILVESEASVMFGQDFKTFLKQPDAPNVENLSDKSTGPYLLYLDVWERFLTAFEDDNIREVALGGPDTAARTRLVWQVKALQLNPDQDRNFLGEVKGVESNASETIKLDATNLVRGKLGNPASTASLIARAQQKNTDFNPCAIPPESRYRGLENQLYRVEIQTSGSAAAPGTTKNDGNFATFKWSRDNGSVIFPVVAVADNTVTLASLGRDSRMSLDAGDWVELSDDDTVLNNEGNPKPPALLQVQAVDPIAMMVTLSDSAPAVNVKKHALLRRWDSRDGDPRQGGLTVNKDTGGAALVIEGSGNANTQWLTLEDGLQIQFQPSSDQKNPSFYQAGDYWLIPARVATGDVEWPIDAAGKPQPLPARSTAHHYAPLAYVENSAAQVRILDMRRTIS